MKFYENLIGGEMIVRELIDPKSIAVIGASNDTKKPGGKILYNIIAGGYQGDILPVNPKEEKIQGYKCYPSVEQINKVELAILAIPAKFTYEAVKTLAEQKGTKAFIILSAGFGEFGEEGKKLEKAIVEVIEKNGGTLIGPNCIGVLNTNYKGVFAGPIPKLDPQGCDFVSGSGATAVFMLEVAIPRGLKFNSIISVGNSAQIGVEEVLKYWDENFDPEAGSKVKLLYMEKIDKPDMFLKHAKSLINKGCRIAGIKAGTTSAGSRAVSSHTGALAGSDAAVDALFKKAGIARCHSRVELVYTAAVYSHKKLNGPNIAVITHAGGPGVMLTDTLVKGGLNVPPIEGPAAEELLSKLYFGSSVSNPIDFIATGTAEQLGNILDYVENEFHSIDGSAVVFGTTGMFDVKGVYDVLHQKMNECGKPIFPVLPSVVQAAGAVNHFLSLGRINFTDEVSLGRALCKTYHTPEPHEIEDYPKVDVQAVRNVIENANTGADGYLRPEDVQKLLDAAGISRVKELVTADKEELLKEVNNTDGPVVMKVVGPVHKSDLGGVLLNINTGEEASAAFDKLMKIEGAEAVMLQPMISGTELFAGAKKEDKFGHLILCGIGGIFIEVLKDVAYGLAPLPYKEVIDMIHSLKAYKLIEGVRGKEGVDKEKFADTVQRLSALCTAAPEIAEMDINPLLGSMKHVSAVDARIRIEKG